MTKLTNEERIRKWREQQGIAGDEAPAGAAGSAVPTRREEELEAADALRAEIAESRLPRDTDVDEAVATTERERWWQQLNLRRRTLRIVGIPLLVVAVYGLLLAPSDKAVDSSFVIMRAGEPREAAQATGLVGIGGGEGLADAYRIREYLESREAMLIMEKKHGFLTHFREGTWDPFSRPVDMPLLGFSSYTFYKRKIDIGIDVREGIVRLEVEALTPQDSKRFANGLLALARERTKSISDLLNTDQSRSFEEDVRRAQGEMRKASEQLASAQRRKQELDPQTAATTIYQLVANLEATLVGKQAQRDSIIDNGMTESPLLARLNAEISSLRKQIAQHRARLAGGGGSLADASSDLAPVTTQLRLAQLGLEASLRTLEQANLTSIGQRRYLVVISEPVLPHSVWQSRLLELLGLTLVATLLLWGAAGIVRSSLFLGETR